MPFCPSCRAEYLRGVTRCADCDVDLVEALSPQASDVNGPDELRLAELASFPNASEAEMIQELLTGNGIDSVIRGDADPIGAISGAEPATLLVAQKDLARAREIYYDFFAGDAIAPEGSPPDPMQPE